ncbi:MAG TPA: helix-turn-helix transcriptional regulator [Nocardioides sp.]|nr:helix-turn-helix transcriptional regulator [Nocardioides sp.]
MEEIVDRLAEDSAGPVLANALALVHIDADDDVRDLAELAAAMGAGALAAAQEEVLAPVDREPGRPLTTRLVRVLGERAWGRTVRTPGTLTHESASLRELCGEAALRLLMVGDGGQQPPPVLRTEADVLEVFRSGDVVLWRSLVAATMTEPWTGRAADHLALLDPDHRPGEAGGIKALTELCRRIAEEDERRAVADHIRRTIVRTGLTQREFATLVGTSPSRLSTYVTGTVTPSAAMLLRINRTAKRSQTAPTRTDDP